MSKIPNVKTWRLATSDGRVNYVDAPTRTLAILNYRHEYGYASIESVSLAVNLTRCAYVRAAFNAERVERIGRKLYRVHIYGEDPFAVELNGHYVKMVETAT